MLSRTTGGTPSQPKVLRRTVSAETAATLTGDHGSRSSTRGTAKRRPDSRLHGRRKNGHRLEAHQRPLLRLREQRVVRRVPPVARSRGGDHRDDRRAARRRATAAASSSAPIFQRIAEADAAIPRRCARRSTRRRRCWSRAATASPAPITPVAESAPPIEPRGTTDRRDRAGPARHERARRHAEARAGSG